MRAAIPLHHSTQLFSATAATLLLLLLLVPLLLLPTTTAEKIILHENQEAQQTFRAMETSKQTSPFLSATLKTNISPVYSEINQVQLNALGYKIGKADGILGKNTISAIKKFQVDNSLFVDGKATASLLVKLVESNN